MHPILRYVEDRRLTEPGYSQRRFALQVGLSPSYVTDLIRGRSSVGRLGALRIVRGTGGKIDLMELMSWVPVRNA